MPHGWPWTSVWIKARWLSPAFDKTRFTNQGYRVNSPESCRPYRFPQRTAECITLINELNAKKIELWRDPQTSLAVKMSRNKSRTCVEYGHSLPSEAASIWLPWDVERWASLTLWHGIATLKATGRWTFEAAASSTIHGLHESSMIQCDIWTAAGWKETGRFTLAVAFVFSEIVQQNSWKKLWKWKPINDLRDSLRSRMYGWLARCKNGKPVKVLAFSIKLINVGANVKFNSYIDSDIFRTLATASTF